MGESTKRSGHMQHKSKRKEREREGKQSRGTTGSIVASFYITLLLSSSFPCLFGCERLVNPRLRNSPPLRVYSRRKIGICISIYCCYCCCYFSSASLLAFSIPSLSIRFPNIFGPPSSPSCFVPFACAEHELIIRPSERHKETKATRGRLPSRFSSPSGLKKKEDVEEGKSQYRDIK